MLRSGVAVVVGLVWRVAYLFVRKWRLHPIMDTVDRKELTRNWITVKISQLLPPSKEKNELLRGIGVKIGKDVFISPDVLIDPLYPWMITIEDGVFIGWGARIFSHMITPEGLTAERVFIGKNAFIGGFTTVRPGVVIGEGAYIGSDSLVTKDVPNGVKAYGIPARVEGMEVKDVFEVF